jgi:hypothetical protein
MDRERERLDEVERLRTDYLRELTALSKMLIALSSGALTLLLSPSGISLSIRAGNHVTVIVWSLWSLPLFLVSLRYFCSPAASNHALIICGLAIWLIH